MILYEERKMNNKNISVVNLIKAVFKFAVAIVVLGLLIKL